MEYVNLYSRMKTMLLVIGIALACMVVVSWKIATRESGLSNVLLQLVAVGAAISAILTLGTVTRQYSALPSCDKVRITRPGHALRWKRRCQRYGKQLQRPFFYKLEKWYEMMFVLIMRERVYGNYIWSTWFACCCIRVKAERRTLAAIHNNVSINNDGDLRRFITPSKLETFAALFGVGDALHLDVFKDIIKIDYTNVDEFIDQWESWYNRVTRSSHAHPR